jgi:hypothetical protein
MWRYLVAFIFLAASIMFGLFSVLAFMEVPKAAPGEFKQLVAGCLASGISALMLCTAVHDFVMAITHSVYDVRMVRKND